jgi:hypothetical protein
MSARDFVPEKKQNMPNRSFRDRRIQGRRINDASF